PRCGRRPRMPRATKHASSIPSLASCNAVAPPVRAPSESPPAVGKPPGCQINNTGSLRSGRIRKALAFHGLGATICRMTRSLPVRVMVIDDDERACRRLQGWLEDARFTVTTFTQAGDAVRFLGRGGCHLGLVGLRLPDMDGPSLIADLLQASPMT